MPGVFGILTEPGSSPVHALSVQMASQLEHGVGWFMTKQFRHQFGFCGVTDFEGRLERSHTSSNENFVLIYGDIYSSGDLGITAENQAKTMLSLYEKAGLDFLKQLNGSFVISIYDGRRGELIIATDRYGSRNLFYSESGHGLIYASEIKAILAETLIKPQLNTEAVAEFFTFSFLLGNKTFSQGIELLSPASILICDFKGNQRIEHYWDFEFHRDEEPRSLESYLEEFDSVMERAVELRMADKDKIGIFLSGGLDSRLIAGFAKRVADGEGKKLISFTFGTKGGWQGQIARQVAGKLGIENIFYEIPSNSIAKYAEEIVYKGDGHIRIRDAHFMSLLSKVKAEVDTVLVGLFCSESFGEVLHRDILEISSKDGLIDYLFDKYRVKKIAEHMSGIFSKSFPVNLARKVRESFSETVNKIPFDSYDQIADYWELRQRDRRYIIPLSNYVSWYMDTRLPYLDNDVVDFAVNLPLELRFEKLFIHKASRYTFPNLANIPWEKSGVAPDITGLSLMLSKVRRAADVRLKNTIERIAFGKVLFKPQDYRGYEYWLRTGSRKYIEDVFTNLPNDGILDRSYVQKIVAEHMSGKRNHDQLICDILNLELLLRKFSNYEL